ncbi:MAG: hypothetical protein HY675_19115 [Chloroflexi bacterium]|nr:hypothetical protein [Chloroflexota bacterium]
MIEKDPGRERLRQLVEALPESDAVAVEAFIRFLAWQRQGGAGGNDSTVAWLDFAAEEMADGIAAAEDGVPADELNDWLKAVEAAVKPL